MTNSYIGSVIEQRLNRRELLQSALLGVAALPFVSWTAGANAGGLGFQAIAGSKADQVVLPPGYTHDVVIRWGDSLSSQVASMDTAAIPNGSLLEPKAAQQQLHQFGSNCDAIHFFQLNTGAMSNRGVLCVNHEYTNDTLMFPGGKGAREHIMQHPSVVTMSKPAHGISVVEVQKHKGRWSYRQSSGYNRRITADTPLEIKGPARGYA